MLTKSKRAQNLEAKIGNENVTGVVEITIPQGVVLRMKPVTSVNKRDTWRKFAQIKRNREDMNEVDADKQYNWMESGTPPNTNSKRTSFKAVMRMVYHVSFVERTKEILYSGNRTGQFENNDGG